MAGDAHSLKRHGVLLFGLVLAGVTAAVAGVLVFTGSASPFPRLPAGAVRVGGDEYRFAVYVPPGRRGAAGQPLVVVLHGCAMTDQQAAAASGYDRVAQHYGFVVLYPEVDAADRANGGCWKGIWNPAAEGRGRGDARAIVTMTNAVINRWHLDPERVYAIGISAGGFETPILAATYPDVYAAIGIHSGAAYEGGEQVCLTQDETPSSTPNRARAALAAMGPRARIMPTIVFHGDHDGRIPYECGRQALEQWVQTDNLILEHQHQHELIRRPTVDANPGGRRRDYTVVSYLGQPGCAVAQLWTVHGMGHSWSGGPSDPALARYTDPRGPPASLASWVFFSQWERIADHTACTHATRLTASGRQ